MGADVTHVDSVKPVLSWARENMEVSKLDSIRWMAEDALKFVKREARRGKFYQGILLDPPAYGRGPDGEKWVLEEQIDELLRSVKEILDPKEHILLTNVYSLGFSTLVVENLVNGIFNVPESAESGELYLNDQYDKKLPLGVFHRYLYQS
jgi:23S rRNA (cytosine1962-C5)-methyltransferase